MTIIGNYPGTAGAGPTDGELWRRSVEGDPAAFSLLYRRHLNAVLGFCLRRTADLSLAEDLAATVFLEAWRCRCRLRLSTSTARPLLLGIANNLLRHHWRARRRHAEALTRLRGSTSTPSLGSDEDAAIARLDAKRALRDAHDLIKQLPRRELEVLSLVAWGELTYEETAVALGIPVGTVRSRLSRAREKLTALMGADWSSNPLAAEATATSSKGRGR